MLNQLDLLTVPREPRFPHATLDNEAVEMPIPTGRPDIVVNPCDFEEQVRNEDYRYHRLPMGSLTNLPTSQLFLDAFGTVNHLVAHGDGKSEGLLFPVLYPYGRGFWRYQRPQPLPFNRT
jgi:hypothetical protein